MNRQLFNARAAQYATPEVSGDGLVSWDGGKKCVIPSVKLYGAAVQDGTPTPDMPVMPVCNNGVFVSRGWNLFDAQTYHFTQGKWVNATNGELISGDGYAATGNFVPCTPGTQITLNKGPGGNNPGFAFYTSELAFLSGVPNKNAAAGTPVTAIVPDGATFMRFTVPAGETDIQIELGSTPTPYTPYYDGGQAQAPELWAIPGTDIRDEWDPQTGRGIRRVKKVVLDGTETWYITGTLDDKTDRAFERPEVISDYSSVPVVDPGLLVCSHLGPAIISNGQTYYGVGITWGRIHIRDNTNFETLDDFVAYLAAQYAAGTPVTIWYALATPEPFYSPPAKLTMPTGFGQIIQTGGDVPNCPITAKYLTHS